MYNLLIAFAAGLALALGVRLAGFSLLAGIIPGTITFLATYIVLARRVFKRMQALSEEAHALLGQATNPKDQKAKAEKAIKIFESALPLGKWQFLVESQVHGAIGQIKYMLKDFDGAQEHFAKANARDYMSLALQGALFFQRKSYGDMEKKFEAAVKSGKKEGLVWAAYAWCLTQLKEKDKALKVMARAVEANPSDDRLKAGLTALQNDKKLKMKPFEPMWWSFGLETPPLPTQGGGRQVRFQRR
ncbi:MAG: tetratricopeptide repeat protein [Myxococcota bacterium]